MTNVQIQKTLAVSFALILAAVLILCEPISLPTNLDFSQLYVSLQRAYEGTPLYRLDDHLIDYNSRHSEMRGAFPFPGPPWYVALFFPLGMLSPEKAAFAWAIINVAFLGVTIALTCPTFSVRVLGAIIATALLAAPVQGHLIVGQFSLIVGLGIALTIWASSHHYHTIVAVGLALTTLRPHLGLPFVAAFLLWTVKGSRLEFFKQCGLFLTVCALLLAASLYIDPTSITSYPAYLATLNSLAVNKVCDTCSSIPIFATYQQIPPGQDIWQLRFAFSLAFGAILIAPLLIMRTSSTLFISSTVFGILLAAPYLRNYDYVLVIPALLVTTQQALRLESKYLRAKVLSLVLLATFIAGVLPYLTDRSTQGTYLWLSPLMGYMASAVLSREQSRYDSATTLHR